MSRPTPRQRAIVQRLTEGALAGVCAKEFAISFATLRRAAARVERYDQAISILKRDPGNLEALQGAGMINAALKRSLIENRIQSLSDLQGMQVEDLALLPHVGKPTGLLLLDLYARMRSLAAIEQALAS